MIINFKFIYLAYRTIYFATLQFHNGTKSMLHYPHSRYITSSLLLDNINYEEFRKCRRLYMHNWCCRNIG